MPRSLTGEGQARPPVSRAVLLLYNAVYLVGFVLWSPVFLVKVLRSGSYRRGFLERTGRLAVPPATRPRVWIHGVSVGEVKASLPLVRALQAREDLEVVVSTTTPTGRAEAERLFPELPVFYYPLDFGPFPARALDHVGPRCVLLMELELWPNYLDAAERRGVPVAVVNGRISKRSFRGYKKVSRLLPQLDRIQRFCVQNETYAERILALGVEAGKLSVTGNLKYEALPIEERPSPPPALVRALSLAPDEAVLVAGSTHHDEEERIGRAVLELERRLGRRLRLIVAPRHADERGHAAAEDLRRVLRSAGDPREAVQWTACKAGAADGGGGAWVVVDTIGEIEGFYRLATLVFVGGSLVPHGGQNMIEPVALGKPTLFGPHVANFQTDVDFLLEARGAIQVEDDRELVDRLEALLRDPAEAEGYAERARQVLRANVGATVRTLDAIAPLLAEDGLRRLTAGAGSGTARGTTGSGPAPSRPA
ncbi:MAG: glycosyltransferase N-terminal domain-containing protein [Planctomycetota bacterium]